MTQSKNSNLKDPDSQKVEVVVQSPEGEVNIFGELSILVLRVSFSLLMVHHGLEKLNDPGGFAEFVVGKYFHYRCIVQNRFIKKLTKLITTTQTRI